MWVLALLYLGLTVLGAPSFTAVTAQPEHCRNALHSIESGLHAPQLIDTMKTHEIWFHLSLQFKDPYNKTSPFGGKNYDYYSCDDYENVTDTSIFKNRIPIITMNIEQKHPLMILNYPKGKNIVPSLFDPEVKKALNEYNDVYLANPGVKGLLDVAIKYKDHVNEHLHIITLMHRLAYEQEVAGFPIPPFYDTFPELFTPGCNEPKDECCKIDEFPQDLTEEEWKVSYYREDAGFNDFHGSWHNHNPWKDESEQDLNHGELFYYFHNQLVARYDMERLSNGLETVKPLDDWTSSHLISTNYKPFILTHRLTRCANMTSQILGEKLSTYRNNLMNDISNKYLIRENGSIVNLTNNDGIKYVGCAFEASTCWTSKKDNSSRYYSIHNIGHDVISAIGCPSGKTTTHGITADQPIGVMLHSWTAVRDPIFFQWHKFVDNVFQLHKKTLPEYSLSKLAMDGVTVRSISVVSRVDYSNGEGQFHTYNSKRMMTMRFNKSSSTCIYQRHTEHNPFTYTIAINNSMEEGTEVDVNVRIYLAPKSFSTNYEKQRTHWALMDIFKVTLKSGTNTIERDYYDSSVTSPLPLPLDEVLAIFNNEDEFNFYKSKPKKCQCGLPQHLLVPRGHPDGMLYQLFVYITPYNNSQKLPDHCNETNTECGVLCAPDYNKCLHVDSEPMGFPFDRPLTSLSGDPINTIKDLDLMLDNALLHDITIFHQKGQRFSCGPPNSLLNWHCVGSDIFVMFNHVKSWYNAQNLCQKHDLNLYQPKNITDVAKYLDDNLNYKWYWLGSQGNGTHQLWVESDTTLTCNGPWYGNECNNVGFDDCVYLTTFNEAYAKETVLNTDKCTSSPGYRALCG